jgi:molybdopterin molybdotransferase
MKDEILIPVEEAFDQVLQNPFNAGNELVDLKNATGRILDEDIKADRDFPPFDRVMMDGIAVRLKSLDQGVREFTVKGLQAAGDEQLTLTPGDICLEVMTGSVLPRFSDVVIRYEDIRIEDGVATVLIDEFRHKQNIHAKGLDQKAGNVLLKAPHLIRASEIAILATVGKEKVCVKALPKVLVVSTGDELVDVSAEPLPYQIRKSNVHNLASLCQSLNLACDLAHLDDEPEVIKTKLKAAIETYDVLLLSGGVSKGKKDYLPSILDELGVDKHFHRVEQRPGKPFWFGTNSKVFVFAFPGNPVSTYMCALRYFVPWLRMSSKLGNSSETAILAEDFAFKPGLTYFLQVSLSNSEGKWIASPQPGQGSGDLANLPVADAFLELPAERTNFEKGEVFPLYRFV